MPQRIDRSWEHITRRDLRRLSRIAEADRNDFLARSPHLRHYRNRVLSVALCQGHALDRQESQKQAQAVELLDRLPVGELRLEAASESILRRIFEAFRLEVAYDRRTNRAECQVIISGEIVDSVLRASASV